MAKTKPNQCMRTLLLGLGATAITLAACSRMKEEVNPETSATIDTAVTTPREHSELDANGWACPNNPLTASMVLIPMPDGKPYCIDERITTLGEYMRFVREKGSDFHDQPSECSENKDYWPVEHDPFAVEFRMIEPVATANPDIAASCLDFCDAWAYCAWAGKRLCGKRGIEPGKVMVVDAHDAESQRRDDEDFSRSLNNEWFNVCSQGGSSKYPYGNTHTEGLCREHARLDAQRRDILLVRDTTGNKCHGTHPPYDRVYDMRGHVGEWINYCVSDGGCAIQDDVVGGSCETSFGRIATLWPAAGVRCCADAIPDNKANP